MSRALSLLLISCLVIAASAQSSTPGISERILFRLVESGDVRVHVNAGQEFALSELRNERKRVIHDGVFFKAEGDSVVVTSSGRPVTFEVLAPGPLKGEFPAESSMKILFRPGVVEISTPKLNDEPLNLHFPDAASAEIPAGGTGRAEFFRDTSYFFVGSTNVTAKSADGQRIQFSRLSNPLLGGPLREHLDSRGNTRLARSTPLVRINISGSVEGEVRLSSGGDSWTLIAGQERVLSFENGASILVKHDSARASLEWQVNSGVCQFGIAGFNCWRAVAITAQKGAFQWNGPKRVIDLKNESSDGGGTEAILTQLSGRISASILPGTTFQYAQFQDCGSFATSALGDAVLYDRETGETIPVQEGIVSYNEGARVGGEAVTGVFIPVTLAWETDARVQLRGPGATFPISAGTEQTLRIGGSDLTASYASDGGLTLRAAQGNFKLNPAFLPDLAIEIPEGGAGILRLHRQRSLFTAQATADSGADLRVISGGQTYMFLSGDARLTVVLGQNSLVPDGSPAWIFFEGAGGDTTFTSGPQPGTLITPSRIDVSRINQPPVSIIE